MPVNQHDPGAKLDNGKPRLSLVLGGFARALWEVGRIGTFGAIKYSDNGWMSVEDGITRYDDALLRHKLKEYMGRQYDSESHILHQAHSCWNELARLELMLRELESLGEWKPEG